MVSTAGHCLPDKAFSRCLRRDNMGTVEPCAPADVARIDDQPGMPDEFAVIDGIVISGDNDGVIAGDRYRRKRCGFAPGTMPKARLSSLRGPRHQRTFIDCGMQKESRQAHD